MDSFELVKNQAADWGISNVPLSHSFQLVIYCDKYTFFHFLNLISEQQILPLVFPSPHCRSQNAGKKDQR